MLAKNNCVLERCASAIAIAKNINKVIANLTEENSRKNANLKSLMIFFNCNIYKNNNTRGKTRACQKSKMSFHGLTRESS